MDCFFAERYRALLPQHPQDGIDYLEVTLRHEIPAERSFVEVWVQRGIGLEGAPEVLLFSLLAGELEGNEQQRAHRRLPLTAAARTVDHARPDDDGPTLPRHAELIARTAATLGIRPEDLSGHRVMLRYPTLSTALVLKLRLPPSA
jgi:hypothetical protein